MYLRLFKAYIYATICRKERVTQFLKLGNLKIVLEPQVNHKLLNLIAFFSNYQYKYYVKRFLPAIIPINGGTMISSSGSDSFITIYS